MVASVPWAEPGSRFTRDFEAECAWLMTVANQKTVSGFLHVSWRTAGTVARRVAERVKASMPSPFDGLHAIGVDETSHRCFASMFVRQVRQCFSAVWADGFPRCRHRFPVM